MKTVDYGVATVRPATLDDARALAPRLRAEDIREVEAAGLTPLASLQDGVKGSSKVYAVDLHGKGVVALFGVGKTTDADVGAVWMLASPELLEVRLTFLRYSKQWLKELFTGFRVLGNMVDARNTVHINWLRWLGFRFIKKHRGVGKNGEDFIEFVRLRED